MNAQARNNEKSGRCLCQKQVIKKEDTTIHQAQERQ
jgi:hypothetical protein